MKKKELRAVVEDALTLSAWQCDRYDYGPCADSVQMELDRVHNRVAELLYKRLDLGPAPKGRGSSG